MDGTSRISNSGCSTTPQGAEPQTQVAPKATTIDPFGAGKITTGEAQNEAEPGTQPHSGNEQPIAQTASHELIRQGARYFIEPNTQGN